MHYSCQVQESHFPFNPFKEAIMAKVSKLYTSVDNIYQTRSRQSSVSGKHGDVKHIVFKDGVPVRTEIIQVKKKEREEKQELNQVRRRNRSRITAPRQSSEAVYEKKRKKLSERLKKAITASQTLWSEGEGIWLSYQGNQSFLVKQFSPKNQLLNKAVMTQNELLDSSIPGLLDTSWQVL